MAVYAAMVDSLDRNIGRVVDELKAQGKWENTLFLFMSDNGANPYERSNGLRFAPWEAGAGLRAGTEWAAVCNTPFRWYKQNAHRGGVSTPGIIHWPAGLKSKGWNGTPSHLVDIMPTLLELAGTVYPAEFSGRTLAPLAGQSLVPVIQGQSLSRTKPIYYNYANNLGLYDGRFKLVSRRGGPWELYDLHSDPLETRNLADKQPERMLAMSAEWMRIAEQDDRAPQKDRLPRMDKEVPWGTAMKTSRKGEKGGAQKDEQHPDFGKKTLSVRLP